MKRAGNSGATQAIVLAMVSGLILYLGWGYAQVTKAEKAYTPDNLMRLPQESVPVDLENVIRLHIKGNSDAQPDQLVKEKVRDSLLAGFGKTLAGLPDSKEAERVLKSAIPDIEKAAADCLKENGFAYSATALVKMDCFPDKQYRMADGRTVYLPAGQYRALVVNLGKGEGENWWCVMYPPLCYLDLVQRAVLVKGAGTPDMKQATLVIDELNAKDVPVEVRSLLLDILKAGLAKLSDLYTKASAGPERAFEAR
jgi:stage II sporulation protein R